MDLTAWLAEDAELTELEDPLLTFTMEPVGSSLPYDYDVLYLTRNQVEVMRVRNSRGTRNELTVSPGLPSGWTAFNLSSSSSHTQLWHNQQTQLVSLPADMTIDRLTIEGSNITVNCHHGELGWEVRGTKEVVVPLPGHLHRHHLSTYSNTASRPRVTLADTTLQLGWDGANLVDVTHYDQKYQSPLPAAIEHHLYIVCTSFSADILCDILAGEKILKTVNLLKPPAWLTILGKQEDHFFTFYHREAANITRDVKSLSNPGGEDTRGSVMALVAAVVVLALVALALLAVIAYCYYTQKKAGQSTSEETPAEIKEMVALLTSNDSMIDIKSEEIIRVAIIEGDKGRVKALLDKTNKAAAYVEAHIQAKKDIIQIISQRTQEEVETPKNLLVISVLGELQQRIKVVFEAARSGLYKGTGGVKILLQTYGLPGTVRDEYGLSIIHHMVTNMLNDGKTPVWSARDIEDFLKTQQHCINAVDYQGQTVLHTLACHPRDTTDISWGNETQTVDEIWCNMAQIFIDHGCNPTLTDHCGLHPYQKAMIKNNAMLSNFLQEKYEAFVSWDFEKGTQKHEQLVSAAREGNIHTMAALLKEGVPVLPMTARADPLLHAIRHSQRDAVLMLLSAGAPLCNQSIEDVTPLEAAHNTLGLPAVFPAIMRKAYIEKLEMEMKTQTLADSNSSNTEGLLIMMRSYKQSVKNYGGLSEAIFKDGQSMEARDLLSSAAENGLSLTCVLLGLEDITIHPLKDDKNPFEMAFNANHFDTQITLCRDLNMVPFTFPLPPASHLPAALLQEFWLNEIKVLNDICSGKHPRTKLNTQDKEDLKTYVDQLIAAKRSIDSGNKCTLPSPGNLFLYLLAKHDLVYMLVLLYERLRNVDLSQEVEPYSRCTILHVASMYGRLGVIEYLLYRYPHLGKVTIGNFSAAHLAAFGGHKECYQYIQARMNDKEQNLKCDIGLTAAEVMTKYEELCKSCELPLMTRENAICVKNEVGDDKRAHELLHIKGKILGITMPDHLLRVAESMKCNEEKADEIRDKIKSETEKLCQFIPDKKFAGKIVPIGPLIEGNEVCNISYVDFMYETSPKEKIICTATKETGKINVESSSNLPTGSVYRQEFTKNLQEAMKNYVCSSSEISFAPPFLLPTHKGVYIRWVWNQTNFHLLTSYIVPTVEAQLRSNSDEEKTKSAYIANVYEEWIHRPYHSEIEYFTNLKTDDKNVWLACRLLRKLTMEVWWAPRFNTKRYTKPWNTWSVGIEGLAERILKELFKEEMDSSAKGDKKLPFDRVVAVYSRAVEKDTVLRKWVPRKDNDYHGTALSVCGILEYLESLMKGEKMWDA